MIPNLVKASRKLSELDLSFVIDNLSVEVLWFRVMINTKDWFIKRHTHSTFEFHFIASGSCQVHLDDDQFQVGAGEFYLTAPGVYHEQSGTGRDGLIEYSINCNLKPLDDTQSEIHQILKILKDSPCKKLPDRYGLITLFNQALEEAYSQNIGFYNNIKSLVVMIIIAATRAIAGDITPEYAVPLKNQKDDYRLAQITKFITDNIESPISTKDIAKHVFLSEKQLCRIIREHKGVSTKDLILQYKLDKAKELLLQTDLSIKQIAERLGFSSEYYFHQFFKREEGYPPGVYRHNVLDV